MAQRIQAVALYEGLYSILNGDEPIIEKPVQPAPPKAEDFKIFAGDDAVVSQRKKNAFTDKIHEYTIAVSTHRMNLDEYNASVKQIAKAKGLISLYIEPSLRSSYRSADNPSIAMAKIAAQYRMPASRAVEKAISDIEKITLSDCASMTEYLNKIEILRITIAENTNTVHYSEEQTMAKIIRGLPPAYDGFVQYYHMQRYDQTKKFGLDDLSLCFSDLKT